MFVCLSIILLLRALFFCCLLLSAVSRCQPLALFLFGIFAIVVCFLCTVFCNSCFNSATRLFSPIVAFCLCEVAVSCFAFVIAWRAVVFACSLVVAAVVFASSVLCAFFQYAFCRNRASNCVAGFFVFCHLPVVPLPQQNVHLSCATCLFVELVLFCCNDLLLSTCP